MAGPQQIARFSIVLGVAVLVLKAGGWWLTGSAAMFSDALDSLVYVAAALLSLVAVRWAEMPADAHHPYGHQKAEFFAAVVEGALIIIASFTILDHAWHSWRHPALVAAPWAGLALTGLATGLNAIWAIVLQRNAREADARHLWTNAVISVAIVAGVALAAAIGNSLVDTGLAVAVAVHVLWSGLRLVGRSVDGLMDAAPPPDVVERIRRLVAEHAQGALEAHDLRTRHAGRLTYLEFHLVVPGELSVEAAHDICDRIESALRQDMEHLVITIHVEPEAKAECQGVLVL